MQGAVNKTSGVKEYILKNVGEHPKDISRVTALQFGISRQYIARCIHQLTKEGLLEWDGNTSARKYKLRPFVNKVFELPVPPGLEEHIVWREQILPEMFNVADNVVDICQLGFEEMLNNVISHSEADKVLISLIRTAINIHFLVSDDGIGIFKKIQTTFDYDDPRHALLELSKGKLTSDQKGHSGEGIFFTSRMFDEFAILSGTLFFSRINTGDDWLIETEERPNRKGTAIFMDIRPDAERNMVEVYDRFAFGENSDFSRTHVPIKLARYETEQLLSRSQARRVLARFERFKEVMLDFRDVNMIGQAFADEIFRVYQNEHPETSISYANASPEIVKMVKHVSLIPTVP